MIIISEIMKPLKHFLLICCLCFSFHSFSQYYVVGIDIPQGFIGIAKPSIERTFGDHFSVLLNYETGNYSEGSTGGINSQSVVYQNNGKAIMPGFRYYPFIKKRVAPKGLSIGLYYRYFWLEETYAGEDYSADRNSFQSNQRPNANVKTKGNVSNFGFSFAYKFFAGPVIFEPLIGFGTSKGEWDTPNEREKIDPFFNTQLTDFQFSGRVEIKVGFYFSRSIVKNEE